MSRDRFCDESLQTFPSCNAYIGDVRLDKQCVRAY